MDYPLVIVRQFDGRALRRVAMQQQNGRVYVSSERAIRAAEDGAIPPVGFEFKDVFAFDAPAYESLSALQAGKSALESDIWKCLKPFRLTW
jgi:uncharacterized protein YraI